ncbi:autoinducer binding domain-containing protein [Pseudomonas sp. UM16]|uniref:autoinducer binding domain-containing protein n=1 Tax=Pseudomonas sp. UM16 TaxID=3158962 RepID=UPI00398FE177
MGDKTWENLSHAATLSNAFDYACEGVKDLGFDFCSFLSWNSLHPHPVLLSTCPAAWVERYTARNYAECDPRVGACRRSLLPVCWTDALFADTPQLWQEAQAHGLRCGVSQGSHSTGVFSVFSVARGEPTLCTHELYEKAGDIQLLGTFLHIHQAQDARQQTLELHLSAREIEVLQWTSHGKCAEDVAKILGLSCSTVNFHLRNAMTKLGVHNKVAAVARAVKLGLIAES